MQKKSTTPDSTPPGVPSFWQGQTKVFVHADS